MQPYKNYQETMMKFIRPKTVPLGICLLKSKDSIPASTTIVSEVFKIKPSICQLVSIARYEEKMVAAIRPHMACAPGMMCIGMIKVSRYDGTILNNSFSDVTSGEISENLYTENTILGDSLGEKTAIIEGDLFEAIVVAPLEMLPMSPSLMLQYATPAQVLKLIRGYIWKTGEPVEMVCTGRAGLCSGAIAESFNRNKPIVSIPSGDNQIGLAEDDEMIFAVPFNLIDTLLNGLISQQHISMLKYPPSPFLANYSQLNTGIVPIAGKSYERTLIKAQKKYGMKEIHNINEGGRKKHG